VDQPRLPNRRQFDRVSLPAMYTIVEAKRCASPGEADLHGHAYDISEGGARIELDEAPDPGESLDVRLTLPGEPRGIAAHGTVVWVNDVQDDPGPRRMALRFTDFGSAGDRARLQRYISEGALRAAA